MADLLIRTSDKRILDAGDSIVDIGDFLVKTVGADQYNIWKGGIIGAWSLTQGAAALPADYQGGVGVIYVAPDPMPDPPPPVPTTHRYNYVSGNYVQVAQNIP